VQVEEDGEPMLEGEEQRDVGLYGRLPWLGRHDRADSEERPVSFGLPFRRFGGETGLTEHEAQQACFLFRIVPLPQLQPCHGVMSRNCDFPWQEDRPRGSHD